MKIKYFTIILVLTISFGIWESSQLKAQYPQNIPNDPFFDEQWNLYNDGAGDSAVAGADINILRAWKITEGSSDIVISMFDRGIDLDTTTSPMELHHPEMDDENRHMLGKNYTSMWGGDPDNVRDGFPGGTSGHGTWVSGVIFAEKNNEEGIAGIAPRVSALHNRVLGGSPTRREDFKNASLDIKQKASENPNKRYIVNYSAGWFSDPGQETLLQGVQYLESEEVILVSISQNNNQPQVYYPARYAGDFDNVIAVGATVDNDNRCVVGPESGSNYGPELTIVAPGRLIPTTDLVYAESESLPGPYRLAGTSCSTSMAAPHVSGVIGLILSINNQLTPLQVKEILKESADEVGNVVYQNGFHEEMGYGRLNAYQALIHTIENHGAVLGKDKEDVELVLEDDLQFNHDIDLAENTNLTIRSDEGTVSLSAESGVVNIGGEWIGSSAKIAGDLVSDREYPAQKKDAEKERVGRFRLHQNYPNPFNPATKIGFSLPEAADVRLEVFDVTGRQVALLLNEHKPAGHHDVTFDAGDLSSGVYLYRIQAGGHIETRKMLFMK